MTGHVSRAAPFRGERALTVALLCGPGGAAAHVAAGGDAPGVVPVLAVTLLTGAAALLLAGRRLGATTLLALAGLGQLAFHHVMAADGGAHPHPAAADQTMVVAHAVVALLVTAVATGLESSWWALARAALARLLPVPPTPVPAGPVTARPAHPWRDRVPTAQRDPGDVACPRGPPSAPAVDVIA